MNSHVLHGATVCSCHTAEQGCLTRHTLAADRCSKLCCSSFQGRLPNPVPEVRRTIHIPMHASDPVFRALQSCSCCAAPLLQTPHAAYVCPAHGLYCRRYMVWVVQPRRCLASPSPSATSVHGPPRHMGSIRLVAHHTATAEKAAERVQPQRIALFWYGQTLSFDVFLQPHDLESDFWAQHALHAPQAV